MYMPMTVFINAYNIRMYKIQIQQSTSRRHSSSYVNVGTYKNGSSFYTKLVLVVRPSIYVNPRTVFKEYNSNVHMLHIHYIYIHTYYCKVNYFAMHLNIYMH